MIDARLATDPNKNGTSEQAKKAEADARRAAINACKDADGKFFKWCPYMKLCVCQKLGLSDGKHHFESGECPLNKPDCDPAKLAEATELRRRLYGRGRGKAKKQNANVWESADLCPCCDDEADGDLDGPTPRPRAVELAHAQAEVAPDPSLASSKAHPAPSGEADAEHFTLSAALVGL